MAVGLVEPALAVGGLAEEAGDTGQRRPLSHLLENLVSLAEFTLTVRPVLGERVKVPDAHRRRRVGELVAELLQVLSPGGESLARAVEVAHARPQVPEQMQCDVTRGLNVVASLEHCLYTPQSFLNRNRAVDERGNGDPEQLRFQQRVAGPTGMAKPLLDRPRLLVELGPPPARDGDEMPDPTPCLVVVGGERPHCKLRLGERRFAGPFRLEPHAQERLQDPCPPFDVRITRLSGEHDCLVQNAPGPGELARLVEDGPELDQEELAKTV